MTTHQWKMKTHPCAPHNSTEWMASICENDKKNQCTASYRPACSLLTRFRIQPSNTLFFFPEHILSPFNSVSLVDQQPTDSIFPFFFLIQRKISEERFGARWRDAVDTLLPPRVASFNFSPSHIRLIRSTAFERIECDENWTNGTEREEARRKKKKQNERRQQSTLKMAYAIFYFNDLSGCWISHLFRYYVWVIIFIFMLHLFVFIFFSHLDARLSFIGYEETHKFRINQKNRKYIISFGLC